MLDLSYEAITTLGLEEIDKDFFAGRKGRSYVGIEFWKPNQQIALFWSVSNVTNDAKKIIGERLLRAQGLYLEAENIRFDSYSICITIPVTRSSGESLRVMTKMLENWADEFCIGGGCSVCGDDDGLVKADVIVGFRALMCRACRERLREDSARALREESIENEVLTRSSSQERLFSRIKGILAGLLAGALCCLPWILIVPQVLLPIAFVLESALSAMILYVVYLSYRRAAKHLDAFGFSVALIISAACIITCICIDYTFIINGTASLLGAAAMGLDSLATGSQSEIWRYISVKYVLPSAIGLIFSAIMVVRKENKVT